MNNADIEREIERIAARAWEASRFARIPGTPSPLPMPLTDEELDDQTRAYLRRREQERRDWSYTCSQKERRASRRETRRWLVGCALRIGTIATLWTAIGYQAAQGNISRRAAGVMMVIVFAAVIGAQTAWRWLCDMTEIDIEQGETIDEHEQ